MHTQVDWLAENDILDPKRNGFFKLLKRCGRIFKIIFGSFTSLTSVLLVLYFGLSFGYELVGLFVGLLSSVYYNVIPLQNYSSLLQVTIFALGMVAIISIIISLKTLTINYFSALSRKNLTLALHKAYLNRRTTYNLQRLYKNFNPDQAITQDVDKISKHLAILIVSVLIKPLTIIFYTYKCAGTFGAYGVISLYVFFILFSVAGKFIILPLEKSNYEIETKEGDFRTLHVKIKSHAEEIYFLQGTEFELNTVNKIFMRVIKTSYKIAYQEAYVNLFVSINQYFGSIISYIIIGLYSVIKNVPFTAGKISESMFYTLSLVFNFTSIVSLAETAASFFGNVHRVGALLELIELNQQAEFVSASSNDDSLFIRTTTDDSISPPPHEKYLIKVTNLCFSLPGSNNFLVKNLSFSVSENVSLGICGPSGIGKSSLLRIIAGLWDYDLGMVEFSSELCSPNSIMYLPQNTYLTTGNIYDQIVYPHYNTKQNQEFYEQFNTCIRHVGLSYLLDRDMYESYSWINSLSPGEKQRLQFARLLFYKPTLAIVDEATSSLPLDIAQELYRICFSVNITFISVSHDITLLKSTHKNILFIDDKDVYRTEKVD